MVVEELEVENNHTEQASPQLNVAKVTKPEFTNNDAELLYASCVDVQRISFTPQMEIQLAELITKLRKYTEPITEAKKKYSQLLGFLQQGNSYMPLSKFTQDEKEQNILTLNEEFDKVNNAAFEEWEEIKKMLPLSLHTEEKWDEKGYKFHVDANKQYFIEFAFKTKPE